MNEPLRRIASHYALTPTGLIPWGLVTVDARGTVLSVESCEGMDSHYGVEFYSGILIPGMVNAHTHLELSYMRGEIASGCGFTAFADRLGSIRALRTPQEQEQSAAYHDARMYAEGVSAVGDISNGALTFGIKKKSRILYHTFIEEYGLNAQAGRLAPLRGPAAKDGLRATVTPHSAYSLNEEAFRDAVGSADNAPLSVHFMESREEQELFDGTGAMSDWYRRRGLATDFIPRYGSPAERIIRSVPGDRKLMLVHNTFMTRREADMLMAHFGRNVTFVLCPRSNVHITGRMPPVQILREAGARIALGTDSLASNTSLSMAGELRMLHGIPLCERLQWATLRGAEALGIADSHGSLEAGKRPGIALLEGVDWETMELFAHASTRRLL